MAVRNMIIAGAVVAAGAVGYMASQQVNQEDAPAATVYSPLAYVPADTVFFSGQLEAFPVKAYLQSTTFSQAQVPDDILEELDDEHEPRKRFMASLVKSYFAAARSAESFQSTFALPDQMKAYVYAVGMLPVLRYEVTDAQAFWALLDKAELESGLKHEARTEGELAYRAYRLDKGTDAGKKLELLVAFENGWATWTLSSHLNDPETTRVTLAQAKPASSLANVDTLQAIQDKHGFLSSAISYIDHQGLVTAFTTEQGNALATMLTKLLTAEQDTQELAAVRTEACQQEMAAIAANWPRTVFGLRDMDITPQRSYMKAAMLIESNNTTVMNALSSMQGYLPAYLNDAPVFGMGLGLDANELGPALSTLWGNMLEPTYQCQPLQEMQAGVREANPAALAMFTGMAQGVKSIALAVNDFTLDMSTPQPQLSSLDGIISLSAENPDVLFNMAKAFAPPLAHVELPKDGSPVALSSVMPLPPEVQLQPQLAMKGQHLVIFNGQQGEALAEALAQEQPVSNGMFNFSMDYKKVLSPVLPVLEASADPEVTEQLAVLKNMDMRVNLTIGLTPAGIEMASEADIKAPKQP